MSYELQNMRRYETKLGKFNYEMFFVESFEKPLKWFKQTENTRNPRFKRLCHNYLNLVLKYW